MRDPRTLRKRGSRLAGRRIIMNVADVVPKGAIDIDVEYASCVASGELDGRARGAGHGRTSALDVDRLLDTEIVALPQR